MVNPVIPTVSTNIASDELAKVLDTQDNSFEFYYFKLHTHGATPRALLAYGNAKWSTIYPDVSIIGIICIICIFRVVHTSQQHYYDALTEPTLCTLLPLLSHSLSL